MMLEKKFKNKNILITGGTGLIGRQLTDMLVELNANVVVASLDEFNLNPNASYVKIDLLDFNSCKNCTKDMDMVFHLAGIKGSIDVTKSKPATFFVPLLLMNTNLLEAARLNKVPELVYTSSIGAYHSDEIFREEESNFEKLPMDMYPGWAKRMAELQIQSYKIEHDLKKYYVVRPCNVYGPGDNFDPENAMVIPSLLYKIKNNSDIIKVWGDGSAIRDFAYSKDVAKGVLQTMLYGTKNFDFLNLGSGVGVSIKELIETLSSFLNFEYEFDISKSGGFNRRIMDIKNAKEIINYNPETTLKEGLQATWNWYCENENEYLKRKNYFKG